MISIDYISRVIFVPRTDMTLAQTTPFEIRELDIDSFRLELKNLEDDEVGMPYPDTHRHNSAVFIGGVVLSMVVEIINGYTVTFEDGAYAVSLIGANSNIGDVTNLNSVSIRSTNSAGLIQVQGGGSAADIWSYGNRELTSGMFTPEQILLIIDMVKLHGLVLGSPLVVTPTTRSSGDISQTIDVIGNTVTVERV